MLEILKLLREARRLANQLDPDDLLPGDVVEALRLLDEHNINYYHDENEVGWLVEVIDRAIEAAISLDR